MVGGWWLVSYSVAGSIPRPTGSNNAEYAEVADDAENCKERERPFFGSSGISGITAPDQLPLARGRSTLIARMNSDRSDWRARDHAPSDAMEKKQS